MSKTTTHWCCLRNVRYISGLGHHIAITQVWLTNKKKFKIKFHVIWAKKNPYMRGKKFDLGVHPSIHFPLFGFVLRGGRPSRDTRPLLHLLQLLWENPKASWEITSVQGVLLLPHGLVRWTCLKHLHSSRRHHGEMPEPPQLASLRVNSRDSMRGNSFIHNLICWCISVCIYTDGAPVWSDLHVIPSGFLRLYWEGVDLSWSPQRTQKVLLSGNCCWWRRAKGWGSIKPPKGLH